MIRKPYFPILFFLSVLLIWLIIIASPLKTVSAISIKALPEMALSQVEVRIPAEMRLGETETLTLTLYLSDEFLTNTIDWGQLKIGEENSVYLSFETRLDMVASGIKIDPPGEMSANMSPGHQQTFTFHVTASEQGVFAGTLWVKMLLVPASDTDEVYEKTIFAVPVEIKVHSILGLSQKQARIASFVGLIFPIMLSFYILKRK